jgi:hypothetical protein
MKWRMDIIVVAVADGRGWGRTPGPINYGGSAHALA